MTTKRKPTSKKPKPRRKTVAYSMRTLVERVASEVYGDAFMDAVVKRVAEHVTTEIGACADAARALGGKSPTPENLGTFLGTVAANMADVIHDRAQTYGASGSLKPASSKAN